MPINSRTKGKVGELEFAHLLTDHGFEAIRGQQHAGGTDSPDVRCAGLPDVHFEVKRTQKGNPYVWLAQAIRDAGPGKMPIVAHRKNGKPWIAILPMEDLMRVLILRELYHGAQGGSVKVQADRKGKGDRRALRQKPQGKPATEAVRPKPKRTSKKQTIQQLMQGD